MKDQKNDVVDASEISETADVDSEIKSAEGSAVATDQDEKKTESSNNQVNGKKSNHSALWTAWFLSTVILGGGIYNLYQRLNAVGYSTKLATNGNSSSTNSNYTNSSSSNSNYTNSTATNNSATNSIATNSNTTTSSNGSTLGVRSKNETEIKFKNITNGIANTKLNSNFSLQSIDTKIKQAFKNISDNSSEISQIHKNIKQVEDNVNVVKGNLSDQSNNLHQEITSIKLGLDSFIAEQKSLQKNPGLAKAKPLIYDAILFVDVYKKPKTAALLLREATVLLNKYNDAANVDLEVNLKKAIIDLLNLPEVNVSKTISAVDGLVSRVDSLVFEGSQESITAKSATKVLTSDNMAINLIDNIWQDIKGLVKISKDDKTSMTLLVTNEARSMAYTMTKMELRRVQWAASLNNQQSFLDAIDTVLKSVSNLYSVNHPIVVEFMKDLKGLKSANVSNNLTVDSLFEIRKIVE